MLSQIHKFLALSFEEKKLFTEAYFTLIRMSVAIHIMRFTYLTRTLEQQPSYEKSTNTNEQSIKIARLVGNNILTASAYIPWKITCLTQSMAVQRMLTKRRIAGAFYLGVMKNKQKMLAHSWSQCGDVILTGNDGYEDFTVISAFIWSGK